MLYELYTGKILFSGDTNNDMLRLIMEVKGNFSVKLLKKAKFSSEHFDEHNVFEHTRVDPTTRYTYKTKIQFDKPTKDLYSMLKQYTSPTVTEQEIRKLRQLADLIGQCLTLDTSKRPSVDQLMLHPFIKDD